MGGGVCPCTQYACGSRRQRAGTISLSNTWTHPKNQTQVSRPLPREPSGIPKCIFQHRNPLCKKVFEVPKPSYHSAVKLLNKLTSLIFRYCTKSN